MSKPAPDLCRSDQIRWHFRVARRHLADIWRSLRKLVFGLPGFMRALLGL